jgi:hypothetical protein
MKFARWVFLIAAIYGVVVLVPGLFLERQAGEMAPPAITHPEYYYGFYGSALVWQILFFAISRDPVGLRPLMLLAAAEKLAFFAPSMALFLSGRLAPSGPLVGAVVDGVLMCLFLAGWRASRPAPAQTAAA